MIEDLLLMQIGKLELHLERWDWGNTLEFRHTEVQQDQFYSNEEVITEISEEDAKELVKHLSAFVDEESK